MITCQYDDPEEDLEDIIPEYSAEDLAKQAAAEEKHEQYILEKHFHKES